MSVDIFSDVNVLLTLTLNQQTFLVACQKFRNDVIREKLEVKLTSSIRNVFDTRLLEVDNLIGKVLRGLVIHLSANVTQGRSELLETAHLTDSNKPIVSDYFARQIQAAVQELEKNKLREVEAWIITKFEQLLRESIQPLSLIEFIGTLFQINQDQYEILNTSYAMLCNDLQLGAPIPVVPDLMSKLDIKKTGVNDKEDIEHLASIYQYIKQKSRKAVFVSTDYKDVIGNSANLAKLEIHCAQPIYAVNKFLSLL